MTNLRFAKDLYIDSVDIREQLICDVRKRVEVAYEKSIIPLLAYAKKFNKYSDLYNLDVNEYVQ